MRGCWWSTAVVVTCMLLTQDVNSQSPECLNGMTPAFDVKTIGQSNPAPGALNTLTVSLRSSVRLPASSSIIISGLRGASRVPELSALGVIPLELAYGGHSESTPDIFCHVAVQAERKPEWVDGSTASWDEELHTMTLHVCPGAEMHCASLHFAFTVLNAALPQVCTQRAVHLCALSVHSCNSILLTLNVFMSCTM